MGHLMRMHGPQSKEPPTKVEEDKQVIVLGVDLLNTTILDADRSSSNCRFLRNYEGCPTALSYDLLLGSKFGYANLSFVAF
jgi:hypothetical protein